MKFSQIILSNLFLLCFSTLTYASIDHHLETSSDSVQYQIISSYDANYQEVIVKFFLTESSKVEVELYNRDRVMLKVCEPQNAPAGQYHASFPVTEINDGTYLMNIIINNQMYQQAVFKY